MGARQVASRIFFEFRRLKWWVSTRTKVIRLYDRRSSRSMTLKPFERRLLVFLNARVGEYTLRVVHSDEGLRRSRKGVYVRLSAPGIADQQLADDGTSLVYAQDVGAFSYLGGGGRSNGQITSNINFGIGHDRGFVRLEFVSQMDRYINFDDVRVLEVKPDFFDQVSLDREIRDLLERRPEILNATSIVYADIDLNVVDGSSIWVSSMLSMLAANEPCLFVSKRNIESDIITSNIVGLDNVHFVSAADLKLRARTLPVCDAIALVRGLDRWLPNVRRIYLRGFPAAVELFSTRQFFNRASVYLTDFYTIEGGNRVVSQEKADALKFIGRHARHFLTQTKAIEDELRNLIGIERPFTLVPPPVPNNLSIEIMESSKPLAERRPLKIGYAGKVVPDWGIDELLDWAKQLRQEGIEVEVTIVANKISGGKLEGEERADFIERIQRRLADEAKYHYKDMNREQSMQTMAGMDLVWCFRPSVLEDNTLELSTKLVEMVALGASCICYPNKQNIAALGAEYPFFVKSFSDLKKIVHGNRTRPSPETVSKVVSEHALSRLSERIRDEVQGSMERIAFPKIGIAVHDPKFVDAFASHLKSQGYPVRIDCWEWGSPQDEIRSTEVFDWADVVLCEWGLANAVWYAEQNTAQKPLYIRMHLQEIKERARKFGRALKIENVTKVIFVSENVRQTAIELFGWDPEKTVVIPNYVMPDEYVPVGKPRNSNLVVFGMVGIIPQRKRLDRAVDLLAKAVDAGLDAYLHIKGPRPETLDFMKAPGRASELDFYNEQYARIENDSKLRHRVHFSPWGNDVAIWYESVDFILSCSDFESFHYALADGVLAGCIPLVWPWDEAETLYAGDWLVEDADAALDRVKMELAADAKTRKSTIEANRRLVQERYGPEKIFSQLEQLLVSISTQDLGVANVNETKEGGMY